MARLSVTAAGLAIILATAGRATEPPAPDLLLADGRALVRVKQRIAAGDTELTAALTQLRHQADGELKDGPYSVVRQPKLPGVDAHDYVSLAPYFWPNPDTRDGLPYVRRDGRANPEKDRYDKPQLARLGEAVRTLGLAYFLTGDERYAAHAAKLVRAWFLDAATRMNPNFTHAQFIPGQNTGRGTGLIEARSFVYVLDGLALVGGSPSWTSADRDALKDWYKQFLGWMRTSPEGRQEANAGNNHGSWYDVELAAFALFTGDRDLARQTVEAAKAKRIARQIEPDGSMPRELERTKSLDYTLFNLQALFHLATLGDRVGVDLWHHQTADGRGLRQALDSVLSYTTGGRPWPGQQINKPHLSGLRTLLRRAAAAYGARSYLDVLPKLADHPDAPLDLLLYPPPG
jgi:hypothetical protein